jgi:hypothetical protein
MTATLSAAKLARLGRDRLTPEQYVQAFPPARRVDRLVLRDIAAKADWGAATWGESAFPSVPAIAARIGYCDRSVQYALRRLEADGRLELAVRPGRTNVWRVTRHLASAEDDGSPQAVDNPVRPAPAANGSSAPGGAKVAPDRGPPPRATTPPLPPPWVERAKRDAAGAAAHAPPERRAPLQLIPSRSPAPPARSESPRLMTGGGRTLPDDGSGPPPDGATVAEIRTLRLSRAAARARPCPRCRAAAGEPCSGPTGKLRKANHAERRVPHLATTAPTRSTGRRRGRPEWCGECVETTRHRETPDGEIIGKCPVCHPSRPG